MAIRSAVRFGVAIVGLVAMALPLAVLLPPDPVTTVPLRTTVAVAVCLLFAASYAQGRRSLRRLAAFIVVMQFLAMTLVPGVVVGYAALAALRSVPGGDALLGAAVGLFGVFQPLGTMALVVSRYGLAYYVVYRGGHDALGRWVPF